METQERKKEIIKTAFKLIYEQGTAVFTIKNISKSIGISEPAIYRHFDSKHDILCAIIDEVCSLWEKNWDFVMQTYESELERLIQFYIYRAKEFDSFPWYSIIMFPEIIFAGSAELMGKVLQMMENNKNRHLSLIHSLQERGVLTSDVTAVHVFTMLTGGFRLLVSRWSLQRSLGSTAILQAETRDFITSTVRLLSA